MFIPNRITGDHELNKGGVNGRHTNLLPDSRPAVTYIFRVFFPRPER